MAAMTFIIQGIGKGFEVGSSFWLAHWAEDAFSATASGQPHTKAETNFFLCIYALFGMMGVVGLTLRSIFIAVHRLRASKKLHDELTERILRAPVTFFDVTPIGRILNGHEQGGSGIDAASVAGYRNPLQCLGSAGGHDCGHQWHVFQFQ
jgi:ATP-binding cassette, subfamily C (CFTR/MRP), member 1